MEEIVSFISSLTPQQWALIVAVLIVGGIIKAIKKKVMRIIGIVVIIAIIVYLATGAGGAEEAVQTVAMVGNYIV